MHKPSTNPVSCQGLRTSTTTREITDNHSIVHHHLHTSNSRTTISTSSSSIIYAHAYSHCLNQSEARMFPPSSSSRALSRVACHRSPIPAAGMRQPRCLTTAVTTGRVGVVKERGPVLPAMGGLRTYAQPAQSQPAQKQPPSGASVKPPVPLFGIDGTYASALVRFCFRFY